MYVNHIERLGKKSCRETVVRISVCKNLGHRQPWLKAMLAGHRVYIGAYTILAYPPYLGSKDETSEESVWSGEQSGQRKTAVETVEAVAVVVALDLACTADLQPQSDLQSRFTTQQTYHQHSTVRTRSFCSFKPMTNDDPITWQLNVSQNRLCLLK